MSLVARHRKTTIALGLTLATVALPCAVMLYAHLRSAIEELLPANAPSILALDTLHRRLGDNMQLGLYLSGPTATQLHAFADQLAERSLTLGEQTPRWIDYRPGEIQDFFLPRRALYVELDDLHEIERRLDQHIAYARQKANPFDLGLDEGPPGFDEIFDRYRQQNTILRTYPSGYYDGADGHSLAMVFYPRQGAGGYETSLQFRDAIARVAHELASEMQLDSLRLEFTGDVETVIQEQRSLQSDLLTSSIFVLVLEALLLLTFFRWVPSLLTLGVPLAVGTIVTLALSYMALGSLNASTAFLGSIIVGNGVNPGIILLARFIEERRRGAASELAMQTAVRTTALPTFVAATAAALSYGALAVTTFRGYSQFGFMGALGMWLCWVATYLWLPPVGLALEARFGIKTDGEYVKGPSPGARIDRFFARIGAFAVERWRWVLAFGALATVLAALMALSVGRAPFENDTTKLRSRWAIEPNGYISVSRKMDTILQRTVTPIIVLTETPAEIEPIAQLYQRQLDRSGGKALLGGILTLQGLVPGRQTEKLEVIERLRQKLTPAVQSRLDAGTRRLVDEWLPRQRLTTFSQSDLPASLLRQFAEKDGTLGRMVLLFPRYGISTTDARIVQGLADEARSVPLPASAQIAGSYLIFADMLSSISHDGPIATIIAFFCVFVLSLLLARGARGGIQVAVSLVVGVLWTVGLAAAGGMRLNFLNFIALPITFGIGVDYATNVYGRYRLSPPGRHAIIRAVSHSGAAVAACSATTMIGYSSLLLSRNGALFSFGLLAVVGELACLAAALLVLPAALCIRASDRVAPLPVNEGPG